MPTLPPRSDRRFWTTIALGAVVATLAAVLVIIVAGDADRVDRASDSLDLAPSSPSDDLATTEVVEFDGTTVPFGDLVGGGTPTVVNFFASWCAPCRLEMPELEAVSRDLGGEIAFIGLATQDRPDDALRTVEETGITYRVARDRSGDVLDAIGGTFVMPTTAFLDADGQVVEVHFGELTGDEIRDLIDEHLR